MKKIAYVAPEMEIVELKSNVTLLASSEIGGGGGEGYAPEFEDEDK